MAQRLHISSYDPSWVLEFEAERDRIARALGELAYRIDHNGSTAVPGLEAKPIIDIQVSVEQLQSIRGYADPLAALGYVHMPHLDDAVCPFFHRPREWPHTHHVHVVQSGGHEERRTLAFRDFLREHRDVARVDASPIGGGPGNARGKARRAYGEGEAPGAFQGYCGAAWPCRPPASPMCQLPG